MQEKKLLVITKIQELSAIHNNLLAWFDEKVVVYDYKDTKIVSNSQHLIQSFKDNCSCLWLQRYKNCQQFTTCLHCLGIPFGCLWLQRYKIRVQITDNCTIIFEQSLQESLSDGDLLMVEHHHSNIFDRDSGVCLFAKRLRQSVILLHLRQSQNQLVLLQTEIWRISEI